MLSTLNYLKIKTGQSIDFPAVSCRIHWLYIRKFSIYQRLNLFSRNELENILLFAMPMTIAYQRYTPPLPSIIVRIICIGSKYTIGIFTKLFQ